MTQQRTSAIQVVKAVKKRQQAATGLSQCGGSSPATELTPERLAAMSDDEFVAVYNKLVVSTPLSGVAGILAL